MADGNPTWGLHLPRRGLISKPRASGAPPWVVAEHQRHPYPEGVPSRGRPYRDETPSGCAPCKGVAFQWVRIPPGSLIILAGSSSSDSGGNKRVGALNDKGSFSDSASVRAVTYVNAEQAPKMGLAGADPPPLKGKATVAAHRGMVRGQSGPSRPAKVYHVVPDAWSPPMGQTSCDLRRRSCRGMGDGTT